MARGRLAWLLIAALLVSVPVRAQQTGGVIAGRVVDPQGLAVVAATVTVRGEGWLSTTASGGAGLFRVANVPPGAYDLTVESPGLARRTVAVTASIGAVRDLTIELAVAGVAVSERVAAPAVDRDDADAARSFTAAELAELPTPRDVFSLARAVPGVLLDRVNVAGAETGQQPGLSSKGTRSFDTTWTVDGVVVTDMAAAGSSSLYFDLDNVDEVRFTTSGQDLRQPTGGLGVDIVLPRGTNQWRGGLRFDGATRGMEAGNVPAELAVAGRGPTDYTQRLVDTGAFGGGPLLTDRLWMHASYSAQDIRIVRGGIPDRTELRNPLGQAHMAGDRA